MKDDFENVYDMLEHAIEYAFVGKMQLKFYEFLKYRKTTKAEVDAFLQSSTAKEIADPDFLSLPLIVWSKPSMYVLKSQLTSGISSLSFSFLVECPLILPFDPTHFGHHGW